MKKLTLVLIIIVIVLALCLSACQQNVPVKSFRETNKHTTPLHEINKNTLTLNVSGIGGNVKFVHTVPANKITGTQCMNVNGLCIRQ
jgi:maltose-binding protein MalE